jgi:hypothetical protein
MIEVHNKISFTIRRRKQNKIQKREVDMLKGFEYIFSKWEFSELLCILKRNAKNFRSEMSEILYKLCFFPSSSPQRLILG